jgi:hypothetical protein
MLDRELFDFLEHTADAALNQKLGTHRLEALIHAIRRKLI